MAGSSRNKYKQVENTICDKKICATSWIINMIFFALNDISDSFELVLAILRHFYELDFTLARTVIACNTILKNSPNPTELHEKNRSSSNPEILKITVLR